MAVLNVNGFDLTEYVNKTCDEKLLSGSSRTQTNRAILIKTIESLPDSAIDEIFRGNTKPE